MWFYSENDQAVGPVDVSAIKKLIQDGTINADTIVWREGLTEWKKLSETSLVKLINAPKKEEREIPHASDVPLPVITVSFQTIHKLYLSWLIVTGIALVTAFIAHFANDYDNSTMLTLLYAVIYTAAGVLFYILLYKFWRLIQDGQARATPREAVGLLFVPFYSLYWLFQVFFGFSVDTNKFIERHFSETVEIRKTNSILSISLAIVTVIHQLVNPFITVFGRMSYSYYYYNQSVFPLSTLIFFVVVTGLRVAVMTDYYITSREILEA